MSAYNRFYCISLGFQAGAKIIIPNPSAAAARPEWKGMV